jgi:hypothetical protein
MHIFTMMLASQTRAAAAPCIPQPSLHATGTSMHTLHHHFMRSSGAWAGYGRNTTTIKTAA